MRKFAALLLLACCCTPIHAWGRRGHRIVGLIAMQRLTPVARKNVKALLGAETLEAVSTWPDEYRPLDTHTSLWHYVDVPGDSETYDRDRDCPVQFNVKQGTPADVWRDCVVDRLLFFRARINNQLLDPADRAVSLKYLVHFVGDIHQPFHNYGPQQGGNGIVVTEFGSAQCGNYACNLHSVWDSGLIEHRKLDEAGYVAFLRNEFPSIDPGPLDPVEWSNAARPLVDAALVQPNTDIDEAYFQREIPVVDKQLMLAGIRLAAVLNTIFTANPKKFAPPVPNPYPR